MPNQLKVSDIVQAAPPATAVGFTVAGIPISEWLVVLTVIYTIVIILIAIRKPVAPWVTHQSKEDPPCAESCPMVKRLKGED